MIELYRAYRVRRAIAHRWARRSPRSLSRARVRLSPAGWRYVSAPPTPPPRRTPSRSTQSWAAPNRSGSTTRRRPSTTTRLNTRGTNGQSCSILAAFVVCTDLVLMDLGSKPCLICREIQTIDVFRLHLRASPTTKLNVSTFLGHIFI